MIPPLAPGQLVNARYAVERCVPGSSFGVSAIARDPDGVAVSLHLFPEASDPGLHDRFFETLASSMLSSTGVIPVLDQGTDATTGLPFLVTPVTQGRTLGEVRKDHGPMEPAAVVRIALDIANALSNAHARNVRHGALTPHDILLEERSDALTTRVGGFGLRQALSAAGYEPKDFVVARDVYTAPEDVGQTWHPTTAADLWSLGVILYECLTAALPFDEPKDWSSLHSALEHDVVPIQERAPWLDAGLAVVVHGLLLRDVTKRCPSAAGLAVALRDLDMAVDSLTPGMLCTVAERRKSLSASRTTLPGCWDDVHVAADDEAAKKLVGAELGGRYALVRLLGVGGMGAVYEAKTPENGVVAVKVVRPDSSFEGTESRRRFVREARSAKAIVHGNVVQVKEAGHDDTLNLPFMVMELLHGQDLGQFLRNNGPMDPSVAARVFADAARGLEAAHALGMIHRDIKPPNIFLHEPSDGTVVPKLCDFGIAKQELDLKEHSSTVLTRTGGLLGSPLYMSPEQAENAKQATFRSDVWSLAISLYETLCGMSPWGGCSTIGEVMLCLYTKEIPALRELAPWVDARLAAVVHRGLRRQADERFDSAAAFADALEPFAKQGALTLDMLRSVHAKKPTAKVALSDLVGVSTSTAGRNRSRRGLLVGVGAVVMVGMAVGVFYGARSKQSEASSVPMEMVQPTGSLGDTAYASASVSERPTAVTAFLRVAPENAQVRLDGEEAQIVEGKVRIERRPGETVRVDVRVGDAGVEKFLVVTSDGRVIPEEIVVELPSAEPVRRPTSGKPGASTKPAEASPQPKETGASHSGPKFTTEW